MKDEQGRVISAVGPVSGEVLERMYELCVGITGTPCTCRQRDNVCDQISRAYAHGHTASKERMRIAAGIRGAHRRYLDND